LDPLDSDSNLETAEGETQKLLHMEDRLREMVVGQEDVLKAVANALRRARTGLQDSNHPLDLFIFLGPTGAGKTELARVLMEPALSSGPSNVNYKTLWQLRS
jgi:ATP-dependent Clp protease ATP-binding subunit ClpA